MPSQRPSSPLRVLFVDNAPFIGGTQVNYRHMVQRMDKESFDLELAIPQGQSEAAAFYADLGIPIHPIPMGRLGGKWWEGVANGFAAARALRSVARRRRIDLLFVSAYRTGFLAAVNRVLTGVPFVWRLCDMNPQYNSLVVWLASYVTCVSEAVRRNYPRMLSRKFEVVYPGVVTEDVDEAIWRMRRTGLRQELGIGERAAVIGCVANWQRWKGPDIAYRAMLTLKSLVPEAELVHIGGTVAGYEEYAGELSALASHPSVRDRIHVLGYRANAYRYYPMFDVLVHTPTLEASDGICTEAFGMTVAEAMGSGIPVVASNVGAIPELVVDGVTGRLVRRDDPEATAATLAELLGDAAGREAMGREAKRRWRERFTQEREVRDYERIFAEVLA